MTSNYNSIKLIMNGTVLTLVLSVLREYYLNRSVCWLFNCDHFRFFLVGVYTVYCILKLLDVYLNFF